MTHDRRMVVGTLTAVFVLVVLPVFAVICANSRHFRVGSGAFTSRSSNEPDYSEERGCIGYRYYPRMYDGFEAKCIGVPFGAWKCYATMPDEGPRWEVPCD